ncbi:MAG: 5'-nucleotidase C-terminal domain-containing protein [Rikenellaceae bacterium]
MKKRVIYTLNVALVLLLWCSTAQGATRENVIPSDTVAIICLNDFHGGFVQASNLAIPGAANIYSCVSELKERYPANIVISAGDNFGGSYFSNLTQGSLIPYFFNALGITVSALGNHEFDNGQEFLQDMWKSSGACPEGWSISYICADIEKDGEQPSYAITATVSDIPNGDEEIKVGLLGLITINAASGTSSKNVEGVTFNSDFSDELKDLSAQISEQNVDLQVLVAHIGTAMDDETSQPYWMESAEELSSLPSPIIGISSGHSHKVVVGRIEDIPVVQGGIYGEYIGVLRMVKDGDEYRAIDPLLQLVGDYPDDKSQVRADLESKINMVLDTTYVAVIDKKLTDKITTVVGEALIHDRNINKNTLTALGSYVCGSYAQAYRDLKGIKGMDDVVLGISHFGSIRRSLASGDVMVLDIGEMLPFSNKLKVYEMTGADIHKIMESGLSNSVGMMQMNNFAIKAKKSGDNIKVKKIHYINSKGRHIKIKNKKTYPVVVDEFITTGGDGYPTALFPEEKWVKEIDELDTQSSFLKFVNTLSQMSNDYKYRALIEYVE